MNMLKSSGLKIPGRGPKHSSPVGRSSVGSSSGSSTHKESSPHKVVTPVPSSASDKSSAKAAEVGDDVLGDFVVGEQVWVNGTKLGCIHYLGETQFAPGQWAGVVLNEPVGKNDGSVGGLRYFECPPLQGIFTRPSKLSRQPLRDGSEAQSSDMGHSVPAHSGAAPPAQRVAPLREGMLNTSVKTGYESGSNMSDSGSVKKGGDKDLRVGDRVLVGGTKTGVVRYMGETDFAKGEWCGVELDEPLGKNDGAVAGTRYFQCPHKFGLFAPVHKVIRIGFPSTSPAKAKKSKRMAMGVSSLVHSPSSSSISSVSSVASSLGGRPSRAGLLTETSARYSRKISGTTALQEALKEKQQHIEQLLAERDLERAEVAKATSHICEVEKELGSLRAQHQQYVREAENSLQQVQALLASTQKEKLELANQLEEERRKVEDLQFCVEEESITKVDLEDRRKVGATPSKPDKRIQQTTVKEKSRVMELEEELALCKAQILELERRILSTDHEAHQNREGEAALETGNAVQLKGTINKQAQEISDLKQRLQQATWENMEMMDSWKGKLDMLARDHQRSLEDLKTSLPADGSTGDQSKDLAELQAVLDSLRAEHRLKLDELKAKLESETALLSEEKEKSENKRKEAEVKAEQLLQELAGTRQSQRGLEKLYAQQAESSDLLKEQLSLAEKSLRYLEAQSQEEVRSLQEKLRVNENLLQGEVIEKDFSEEKITLQQTLAETLEKLAKREKEVSFLSWQAVTLQSQTAALESKLHTAEEQEKRHPKAEQDLLMGKPNDASEQLIHISQELLKKERSLNELRVLLLDLPHHSPRPDRDVIKVEWRMKEQKLQDDIKALRGKLQQLGLDQLPPDHRRYSMIDGSASDSELARLQQRLRSTEQALKKALEQNQLVDQLVQAVRTHHDNTETLHSANGIHQEDEPFTQEEKMS